MSSCTATAALRPPAPMSPPHSDFIHTNAIPANPPFVVADLGTNAVPQTLSSNTGGPS